MLELAVAGREGSATRFEMGKLIEMETVRSYVNRMSPECKKIVKSPVAQPGIEMKTDPMDGLLELIQARGALDSILGAFHLEIE
jgi:hypothetical protein